MQLTNAQLGSIMAYYGATATVNVAIIGNNPLIAKDQVRSIDKKVNGAIASLLDPESEGILIEIKSINLHLRHIHTLTDEEVGNIIKIALPRLTGIHGITVTLSSDGGPAVCFNISMNHKGDPDFEFTDRYWITRTGLFGEGDDNDEGLSIYNPAEVFAYLQSRHIYVPGLIDLQFVDKEKLAEGERKLTESSPS